MKRSFTVLRLVLRTVAWYRRDTVAAVFSLAVCAMVIVGALVTGDSVKYSLEQIAGNSLGEIKTGVSASGRWFRVESAQRYSAAAFDKTAVLIGADAFLTTVAADRSSAVSLYGVKPDFFRVAARQKSALPDLRPGEVILNSHAAHHLGVKVGDSVVLRFVRHSALPADAPFSLARSEVELVRLQVVAVGAAGSGVDFDPAVAQKPALNAFIDRDYCADLLNNPGRANLLVSSDDGEVLSDLVRYFALEDFGVTLEMRDNLLELRSDAVFFPEYLEEALAKIDIRGEKVFGYFVNEIKSGGQSVPYSFIAGIEAAPLPAELENDGVVVNRWLAEQLRLEVGDSVAMTAFVPGLYGSLPEKSADFRVAAIVEMDGAAVDQGLMPRFPGMEKAETCSEWDPALPVDLQRIRRVDEDYWYRWRGLPKAFIGYDTAVKLFGNRFGRTTLVRFREVAPERLRQLLLQQLAAARAGLTQQYLQRDKEHGIRYSVDFSMLFSALGFFIIMAALLLNGLLFRLHIERRYQELAVMQISGFSRQSLRVMLLLEGAVIALIGAFVGIAAGVAFAALQLYLLQTVWQGALNLAQIELRVLPGTLVIAAIAAVLAGMAGLAWSLRSFFVGERGLMLSRQGEVEKVGRAGLLVPALLAGLALGALPFCGNLDAVMLAAVFFVTGFLLLIFATQLCAWLLLRFAGAPGEFDLNRLAARFAVRRFSRSMAVIRVMGCAVFMVLAVSANHKGMVIDPTRPAGGTGGFTHYVETAIPIIADLSGSAGRYDLKLDGLGPEVRIIQAAQQDGSESSCLNLNRVSRPNVVGIDARSLQGRFRFSGVLPEFSADWSCLDRDLGDARVVPAVADAEVIMWSLGKSLGDELMVESASGGSWRLKLVASLDNSIFQGKVLLSTANFYRIWPEAAGSRLLLVEAPMSEYNKTAAVLTSALQRYGAHVEGSSDRLVSFNRVQNTYLKIFLALGAVALLLGVGGLAVLLRRNLLERADELSFMRKIGFSSSQIRRLLFREHAGLFLAGSCSGLSAAFVAVIPVFLQGSLPLAALFGVFVATLAAGMLFLGLASYNLRD